jgi:hypothetical protein
MFKFNYMCIVAYLSQAGAVEAQKLEIRDYETAVASDVFSVTNRALPGRAEPSRASSPFLSPRQASLIHALLRNARC